MQFFLQTTTYKPILTSLKFQIHRLFGCSPQLVNLTKNRAIALLNDIEPSHWLHEISIPETICHHFFAFFIH